VLNKNHCDVEIECIHVVLYFHCVAAKMKAVKTEPPEDVKEARYFVL